MLVDVPLCEISNVLAVIAALGHRHVDAAELPHARLHAQREIHDLRAGVVVVELARHAPAGRAEQRRDRVAERGLAAVTDVQRAGRIRRDELDVHRAALPRVRAAVRRRRPAISARSPSANTSGGDAKVDEARAGDLRRADAGAREVEPLDERLRRCRAASCPSGFASTIARFVAQSPNAGSRGRSMTGSTVAGAPSDCAARTSSARSSSVPSITCRTWGFDAAGLRRASIRIGAFALRSFAWLRRRFRLRSDFDSRTLGWTIAARPSASSFRFGASTPPSDFDRLPLAPDSQRLVAAARLGFAAASAMRVLAVVGEVEARPLKRVRRRRTSAHRRSCRTPDRRRSDAAFADLAIEALELVTVGAAVLVSWHSLRLRRGEPERES